AVPDESKEDPPGRKSVAEPFLQGAIAAIVEADFGLELGCRQRQCLPVHVVQHGREQERSAHPPFPRARRRSHRRLPRWRNLCRAGPALLDQGADATGGRGDLCPFFGVRQCFALPLLFLIVFSVKCGSALLYRWGLLTGFLAWPCCASPRNKDQKEKQK